MARLTEIHRRHPAADISLQRPTPAFRIWWASSSPVAGKSPACACFAPDPASVSPPEDEVILRCRPGRFTSPGDAGPRRLTKQLFSFKKPSCRYPGAWMWAQGGYGGRVGVGWVRKISRFWQKRSPNCDFYSCSTFWSSRNLTGGSGVRGKAGPNWVRKVFNCLRSL
jgi:hypothetical protein